jgi:hypothetical protein
MPSTSKRLTGDKESIDAFLDKFDVGSHSAALTTLRPQG